jgi:hypothetical protein
MLTLTLMGNGLDDEIGTRRAFIFLTWQRDCDRRGAAHTRTQGGDTYIQSPNPPFHSSGAEPQRRRK